MRLQEHRPRRLQLVGPRPRHLQRHTQLQLPSTAATRSGRSSQVSLVACCLLDVPPQICKSMVVHALHKGSAIRPNPLRCCSVCPASYACLLERCSTLRIREIPALQPLDKLELPVGWLLPGSCSTLNMEETVKSSGVAHQAQTLRLVALPLQRRRHRHRPLPMARQALHLLQPQLKRRPSSSAVRSPSYLPLTSHSF